MLDVEYVVVFMKIKCHLDQNATRAEHYGGLVAKMHIMYWDCNVPSLFPA